MNIYQLLQEATRSELINKSKNAEKTKTYGTTRYDRRTKSKTERMLTAIMMK